MVMTSLDPTPALVQDKLADRVADWLRDAIMNGRLRAGENLKLAPLAERLRVSTTPVREALVHLQKEGLVVGEPRRGFTVARLSAADVQDLFSLHAFIDGVLAERAATALSEDDLRSLTELNVEIKQSVQAGDAPRTVQLNHQLHRTINRAAGPSILHRFLQDIARWAGPSVPGWPIAAGQDHTPIIRALRQKDGAQARALSEQHIRRSGDQVVAHLTQNGALDRP